MTIQKNNTPKRDHLDDILDIRLQQYSDELTSDVTLNEMNIRQKALNRPLLGAKWCTYGYQEENYLKQLKQKLEDFKTINLDKLYDAAEKTGLNESKLNLNKIQFTKLLLKQPEYVKIQNEIDIQEQIIRFIADAKQVISAFGYDITNSKELIKLENI